MLGLMIPQRAKAGPVTTGGDEGWVGSGIGWGGKTKSGVVVSEEIALTNPSVLCATRIYAEGIGGLPLQLFKKVSADERIKVDLPVADLVQLSPNPTMTATAFWEGMISHQLNWDGGAFAEIERDDRGRVVALWPIHPIRVRRSRDPEYDYEVYNDNGSYVPFYADEILHIPGVIPGDGIWSRGLISYGRETIGGAIGTDRASAAWLASGGQPKGVLKAPTLNDREKRESYRVEWNNIHANPEMNVPTIAILSQGWEYIPIMQANGETNQTATMRAINKADIATLYNLPSYKIPGAEGKETAGTVEQKAIDLIVSSFMPVARKIEEQCWFKLLTIAERKDHYFEHNFTALLRGDTTARYNAYRIAFSIGILTINEIRRLENKPSIGPSGDQHFVPANMTTADRALNGDFGNGGAMGSDHNGQPADNPMDRAEAQHNEWLRSLGTVQLNEVKPVPKAITHDVAAPPAAAIDYREGARIALTDVLGRMLTKESNAAQTAMKGNVDFNQWLREFYSKQEAIVADALKAACWNLGVAGVAKWSKPADLAAWLRARNIEALNRCHNSDTPESAARRLRSWPVERAKELTDEIMGG